MIEMPELTTARPLLSRVIAPDDEQEALAAELAVRMCGTSAPDLLDVLAMIGVGLEPPLDPVAFGPPPVKAAAQGREPMRSCEGCGAQWSVRAGAECWCCGKPW